MTTGQGFTPLTRRPLENKISPILEVLSRKISLSGRALLHGYGLLARHRLYHHSLCWALDSSAQTPVSVTTPPLPDFLSLGSDNEASHSFYDFRHRKN